MYFSNFFKATHFIIVYTKLNLLSDTDKAIQYVVRYTDRPAMAQSRILNYDGTISSVFIYRYSKHNL